MSLMPRLHKLLKIAVVLLFFYVLLSFGTSVSDCPISNVFGMSLQTLTV